MQPLQYKGLWMTIATAALKASPVAKDRDKQVTFRLSAELHARVEEAAAGLELDVSSLLRLLIRENLPAYEERAEEIRRKTKPRPEDA